MSAGAALSLAACWTLDAALLAASDGVAAAGGGGGVCAARAWQLFPAQALLIFVSKAAIPLLLRCGGWGDDEVRGRGDTPTTDNAKEKKRDD